MIHMDNIRPQQKLDYSTTFAGKIDTPNSVPLDFDYSTTTKTTIDYVRDGNATPKNPPGALDPTRLSGESSKMTPLPPGFIPGPFDVICGRGAKVKLHPGNVLFRKKIQDSIQAYSDADSKLHKSLVVSSVVEFFRHRSGGSTSMGGGGFVKEHGGVWYSVSDYLAREKTGQAFRDHLSHCYRSATKAKRRRWREEGKSANNKKKTLSNVAPTRSTQQQQDHQQDEQDEGVDQMDDDNESAAEEALHDPFFDELVGVNVNVQMQIHFVQAEKMELDRQQSQYHVPEHVYEMHLDALFTRNNIRLLEGLKVDAGIQESLFARRMGAIWQNEVWSH